ncbi:MAG: hypothetical protein DMD96_06020 [Candidatus Rokuibacteriota bacterium]|nr:MAG: hypothetical protein DMD96_06020 [Candidatus Rokubacteria bacterium]
MDPKGDTWGIRSAANGKGPGLPIVILGGGHGDVPLEPSGGELVAKLVVEQRVSVLLDLADLRKYQVVTFMTGFMETLYRLKNREEYRTPMMLVIDEADAIAPQRPMKGEERMLGAAEDIVRRGGQRGIGITMVTQRAAVLNKNVLSQCGILLFLRTLGLQDIDGVNEWINKHGQPEQKARLMADISSLPRGHAWFWAPGWPDERGIFKRIVVDPIETFDSGATPKPGERRITPKTVADVDLEAFRREMAATIEKAKAEDPRELRRRIAALEGELRTKATHNMRGQGPSQPKRVEVDVVKPAVVQEIRRAMAALEAISQRGDAFLERAHAIVEGFREGHARLGTAALKLAGALQARLAPQPAQAAVRSEQVRAQQHGTDWRKIVARPTGSDDTGLGAGERKMLEALALRHPDPLSKAQLGLLAGYAASGGTFRTYLPRLHRAGLVAVSNDRIALTSAGRSAVGEFRHAPQTPEQVRSMWLGALDQGPRRMLEVLIGAYPKSLTKAELGDASGYEAAGGTFRTYLPKLRRLGLVDVDHDQVRAKEALFS